jgi:hypothetical protein
MLREDRAGSVSYRATRLFSVMGKPQRGESLWELQVLEL